MSAAQPAHPPTPYDEVFYPCHAYPQTHPDLLATQAMLFGLDPPDVGRCRVLEIGCGDGANIIAMAYGLPESRFVGVDLAERPLAQGRDVIARLGLENVSLLHADLMHLPADLEPFDYIIAHGVYSWVPQEVRDGLLEICRTRLSRHGVAFVSYNCFPGSHLRMMLREMMLFHVDGAPDSATKVGQARAFLGLLASAHREADETVGWLRKEVAHLAKRSPDALYHDDLAAVNRPLYFHEFIRNATDRGLQYLAEAELSTMHDGGLSDEARAALPRPQDNRLLREQYLDFMRLRRFRQTLLCHRDAVVRSFPDPTAVLRLRAASNARRAGGQETSRPDEPCVYEHDSGGRLVCFDPLSKAVMDRLIAAWPRSLPCANLLANVDAGIPPESAAERDAIVSELLLRAAGLGVVELRTHEPTLCVEPGDRPRCSHLARLQAERGEVVTNLRHAPVHLADRATRLLLPLIDGTRDRRSLATELARLHPHGMRFDELLAALSRLALLENQGRERISKSRDY